MELILRHALPHRTRAAHATLHHLQQLIDIVRARPLLMLDHVAARVHLRLLHQLAIRAHPLPAVRLRELIADQRGGVQARKRDELPAVAQLREALDVRLLLGARHGRLPVERGRQVVRELLLRVDGVHALGELLRLAEVGQLALHPDGVGVGRVGDGAVDGALAAALEAVVALAGAGQVPIEVDVDAQDAAGDGAGFGVRLAFYFGKVLRGHLFLVDVHAGVDGVDHGVVEGLEAGLGRPGVLDGLKLGTGLAGVERGEHEVVKRLEGGVGRAEDVGVVAGVDGRGDEGGGFGVGTGDGKEVNACGRVSIIID
jgi:hypothetical protein